MHLQIKTLLAFREATRDTTRLGHKSKLGLVKVCEEKNRSEALVKNELLFFFEALHTAKLLVSWTLLPLPEVSNSDRLTQEMLSRATVTHQCSLAHF